MQETQVRSMGWEDPVDKGMATHSSILAWRIPWTVESMGLQSWTRLSDVQFQDKEDVIYMYVIVVG